MSSAVSVSENWDIMLIAVMRTFYVDFQVIKGHPLKEHTIPTEDTSLEGRILFSVRNKPSLLHTCLIQDVSCTVRTAKGMSPLASSWLNPFPQLHER